MSARTSHRPFFLVRLIVTLCLCPYWGARAQAQMSDSAQEAAGKQDADAVVFVNPTSPTTATIGFAYNTKKNHDIVRQDVQRLLKAGEWRLIDAVQYDDSSVHPDRIKEYPPTTGAIFSVRQAPQVLGNAPNLMPYIEAFQGYNHFEVTFELPDLTPYEGVTYMEAKPLHIELTRGQNVYAYDILVRDHKGKLPPLMNTNVTPNQAGSTPVPVVRSSGAAISPVKGLLIILGVGIFVGGGVYLLLSRRE